MVLQVNFRAFAGTITILRAYQNFKNYKTDDFYKKDGEFVEIDQYCKVGFVQVMHGSVLNGNLGMEILEMLQIAY